MLEAMPGQHRLRPLLAWQLERAGGGWAVPDAVALGWREARHEARLAALAQLAGLRLALARLDAGGIACVVLKGPRLAWRCYPEAGLRPMRDLDLLVAPDAALRAADLLAGAGFACERDAAVLAEALAGDKHLPPMVHGDLGVALELHHRLSDRPGRHAYRVPQLDAVAALARRETVMLAGAAVPVQPPGDLLAHLMVHALYGHRLDCGPLVLADIHFLLAREPIDGAALREVAQAGGWLRGAQLLLALTERYFGAQPLALGPPPPEAMLAAAEEALLQDLSARRHAILLSDLLAARSAAAFAGGLARRWRPPAHVVAGEGGGWRGGASGRAGRGAE